MREINRTVRANLGLVLIGVLVSISAPGLALSQRPVTPRPLTPRPVTPRPTTPRGATAGITPG